MPVPTPRKGETQQKFVSRCIETLTKLDPQRKPAQISAICYNQWKRKNLEEVFDVKLGDIETVMTLPVTAQGLLNFGSVWLTDEPEDIEQPFTAKAVYQHLWFRGKTKPIRVGPSEEYWILRFQWSTSPLMKWICNKDLREFEQVSCVFEWEKDKNWMNRGKTVEEIPPGKPGNPTKATPAYIEIIDSGNVRIHKTSDMHVEITLNMKELKGKYEIIRRDERMNLWIYKKVK